MRLAALLGLLVLILGLGTVNIEHHLNLPVLDKNLITVHHHWFTHDVTDIRMNEEMKGPNTVKGIVRVLQEAEKGDVVNFHLVGYGGDAQTCVLIINNIKKTKATVNMLVEAPVYSAHAYLATQGNTLTMSPYSFLMFHTGSEYGTDCSKETGTDRTVSNAEHCQKALEANLVIIESLIKSIPLLTSDEKALILTGHDVYIQSDDYNNRTVK